MNLILKIISIIYIQIIQDEFISDPDSEAEPDEGIQEDEIEDDSD